MTDIPQALVDKAAEVVAVHRWETMGVSSVTCECGEILYGDDSLTQFAADEAFRAHLARAVLAAVWPDVGAAYERGFSDGEDSALRFNPPEVGDRHG